MGHRPKLGLYGKNWIFWQKTKILGPKKKESLFDRNHVLATTGKSCSKKKVVVSKKNISLLRNFGCFLCYKAFLAKKTLFG